MTTLSFTEPGRFRAVAYIDGGRVVRVESRIPDPVLGETDVVTTYGGYADFGGFAFPTRITQTQGGYPVLDLAVREVVPNAPADIALPDAVRTATERVTVDKVADGVWFVAGGSHNSVAIEMKDYLILVEAPLNDGRTVPVIDAGEEARAGQAHPLRRQLPSPFRPCRRRARGGRRGRDDHHAGAEQGVLRARVRDAEHDRAGPPRQVGQEGRGHGGRRQDGPSRRHAHGRDLTAWPTATTATRS